MGYYSDVRIVMTKKAWDYVKEHAPKLYEDKLRSLEIEKEDDDTITSKTSGGFLAVHSKNAVNNLLEKPTLFWEGKDHYTGYVMVGWDCIKWIGYSFDDKWAITKAIEDSGEPARGVYIGEDSMVEEQEWGDYYGDVPEGCIDDPPMLEAHSCFDYGDNNIDIVKLEEGRE